MFSATRCKSALQKTLGFPFQPPRHLARKQRREGLIYPGIVLVQPFQSLRSKQVRQQRRCIDMAAGQGLERKPVTEFGCTGLTAEDNVLMTDAVHAFTIKSRLVGGDHARQERLGIILITDALRPFVNTKVVAYTVTGAVTEVASSLPERHSGNGVYLTSCSSARKDSH